jgi:hypothetical protein
MMKEETRMGTPSSRRLRREELEDLAVRKERWKLRFYCWRWSLVLGLASIGTVIGVMNLLHGSTHGLAELLSRPWLLGP